MIRKALNYKLVRYALTGGLATAVHITIAYCYIYFINNALFIANILGFIVAFIFSYLLQSLFVFKHTLTLMKAIKFFSVQFSSLLISILSSDYLPLENSYFKTIIVVLLLPLFTYIIHKFWTFKENSSS